MSGVIAVRPACIDPLAPTGARYETRFLCLTDVLRINQPVPPTECDAFVPVICVRAISAARVFVRASSRPAAGFLYLLPDLSRARRGIF
jgi:hypothetical protein